MGICTGGLSQINQIPTSEAKNVAGIYLFACLLVRSRQLASERSKGLWLVLFVLPRLEKLTGVSLPPFFCSL